MLPMGGSEDPDSVLGPLISEKQRQRVEGIVTDGVAARRRRWSPAASAMDRKGYFYEATIITNTTPDMRLIREEIFGPVGCVIPFDDEDEVLAAANDTEYGLAGAIWTENLGRAHRDGERASRRPGLGELRTRGRPVDADLRPQAVGLGRRARQEGYRGVLQHQGGLRQPVDPVRGYNISPRARRLRGEICADPLGVC